MVIGRSSGAFANVDFFPTNRLLLWSYDNHSISFLPAVRHAVASL